MRGDTLQTFEKKFQNNFFSLKINRFQADFFYKKLMSGDTLQTFEKKFQNNCFSLKNSLFQVDLCYKKLIRGDKFQKNLKIIFFIKKSSFQVEFC